MRDSFESLIKTITQSITGRPVDTALEDYLNRHHGPDSDWFRDMARACAIGVDEGWLCNREAGGVRYGHVVKPGPDSAGFSVDVVDMADLAGPHHVHPNGEIDLVMPQTADARFDGTPAGWKVYPPRSAHRPTVTGGRALVLYLLPDGAIEFTKP